jgi:hypothetical protein
MSRQDAGATHTVMPLSSLPFLAYPSKANAILFPDIRFSIFDFLPLYVC